MFRCRVSLFKGKWAPILAGTVGQLSQNSHVDMVRLIQNTWFIATVVPWISLDGMSYSSVFSCVILFGTDLFLPTSVCRFIVLHMFFFGLFEVICTHLHSRPLLPLFHWA